MTAPLTEERLNPDECSDERLRHLWMECGGGFNKQRGQFFVERDLLPELLRKMFPPALSNTGET